MNGSNRVYVFGYQTKSQTMNSKINQTIVLTLKRNYDETY